MVDALDEVNRPAGRRQEGRDGGRDVVTRMAMLSARPDWLASELRSMGIAEDGDEVVEAWER